MTDPLRLAWELRAWDVGGLLRQLWREKGLSPAAVARALSPFEVAFLYADAGPARPDPKADPVGHLARLNARRAQLGLKPHVPPWLALGAAPAPVKKPKPHRPAPQRPRRK